MKTNIMNILKLDLKPTAKIVLIYLLNQENDKMPTYREIGMETGMTERTVFNQMKELKTKGILDDDVLNI